MDRVVDIAGVLQREVEDYARGGDYKAVSYFVENADQCVYGMVTVPDADHPFIKMPQVVVWARILADKVVIDCDITDKPLVQELVHSGIPREQIVLAYAGEKIPDEA